MGKHPMRHYVSLAGKVLGALIVGGPAIAAVSAGLGIGQSGGGIGGNAQDIPRFVLYNYTGFDPKSGNFNAAQLGVGIASVAGGLILMKVFSYIARRF